MNAIERTEWIDRYLAGTLLPKEKNELERLLSDPVSALSTEMQLQQDIIMAIREQGLRQMLQAEYHKRRQRRILLFASSSVLSLLVAAVVALLFIVAPLARQMYSFSNRYATSLMFVENIRGNQTDSISGMLTQAQTLILHNDWKHADHLALQIINQTNPDIEQQADIYHDAEWLHVQCLMHLHRPLQARRLLRKIAAEDGHYSTQAQHILDNIK